jgi:two-component system sensor histidine kinase AlgZ
MLSVSIRQDVSNAPQADLLPDFRNLGVIARVLVGVNLFALAGALAASSGIAQALERFIGWAALIEPLLMACMIVLYLAAPMLARLAYWQGCAAVLAIVLALAAAEHAAIGALSARGLGGEAPPDLARTMALGALAAALLLGYLRLFARAHSPALAEARLQALQARIRPHFLFNSLNTVLGLIRTDPRLAEHTLENLADLFRVFMRDARELVPLDDEVITCKEYLAIEQLRLSNRLKVAWDIDEMPGDALLPSLLLQPLLENAVHHGIEPRMDEGLLAIRITKPGDRVRVEIDNPLSATPAVRSGNQMALSNVRERLMLLYDMEAELKTGPQGDRFRLHLEFPYRKERRRRDVRRNFNPDR